MGRILRTELRRSAALWTALAVILLGAAMLYPVVDAWGGRWTPLALWQREYLFVLWPLGLGAGAWQARRESRSRVGELFATTARPRWQRVTPTVLAMGIAVVAGYLGMFATGAGQVALNATYLPAGLPLIVAVGALSMVAAVWIGLAVGSFLPSAITPPGLVVGGLMAMLTLPLLLDGLTDGDALPGAYFLLPILFRAENDFTTITASLHVAQAVWLVALAAAGFLVFAGARVRSRLAAIFPVVLGGAVALAVIPSDEKAVTTPDAAAAVQVCTSDAPRICVTKVHAAALDDLREPGRKALAVLADKLPNAPTSLAESPTSWINEDSRPQPAAKLLVELDVGANGRTAMSERELLWELLDGAGTRRCANTVNDHILARAAAAAWLLGEAPPTTGLAFGVYDPDGEVREALDTLRGLPVGEQRARVTALRTAALACETTDLMQLLVAGSAAR